MKTNSISKTEISKDSTKQKASIWTLIRNHPTVFSLLLGALAVTAVYFWKDIQSEKQKVMIVRVANQQIESNQQELVKLMAKPLVWNIRSEMLRGNMEQVNILITDMVKEPNFRYIHLVSPNGNVILSTNKSLEGKPVGKEIDSNLLKIDAPTTAMYNGRVFIVAAPVMGVDKRLATLVVGYATTEIKLQ